MSNPINPILEHFSFGDSEVVKVGEIAKDRYLVASIDLDTCVENGDRYRTCLNLVSLENGELAILDEFDSTEKASDLPKSLAIESATDLFDNYYVEVCLEQQKQA